MGPYCMDATSCTSRAVYTNDTPAGAFRGFGVPQAAIALETLLDDIAERLGIDPLELRHRNALDKGSVTCSGQKLEASVGLKPCLDALRAPYQRMQQEAAAFNAGARHLRRGVGVGCGWYGIGNTSLSNPSVMRVGLGRDGRITLYNGALDIGQGSNTIMLQIVADALGVPVHSIALVSGDTDLTADAGKTSASRQTFVSGTAARLAAEDLKAQILRLANAGDEARFAIERRAARGRRRRGGTGDRSSRAPDGRHARRCAGRRGQVRSADDAARRRRPGRTLCDLQLLGADRGGRGRYRARHDEGAAHRRRRRCRPAINPMQVEGQIHGGVAQGLGLALMEEFIPGRTENLHDYLIPTIGDVPPIDTFIIEDPEPLGPYGAKGIGEPALIPTAPAILNAIRHATGARITQVPATPDRVRAAIRALAAKKLGAKKEAAE